jgi:hypothetical protein
MTGLLALGCLATGFIVAWMLRTILVMAQISWMQEQMQQKVRYWQGQTLHARTVADRLRRQLAALADQEPEPPDWSVTDEEE